MNGFPIPWDFWFEDPLPVTLPPAVPRDSMAWHRWNSAEILKARKERES